MTLDKHDDGNDVAQQATQLALTAVGCEVTVHMVEVGFSVE